MASTSTPTSTKLPIRAGAEMSDTSPHQLLPATSGGGHVDAHAVAEDSISFAELPGHVIVIRVTGRGSFANSVELKKLADLISERSEGKGGYHLIADLDRCTTMDSTFMGVLASVGLRQRRETGTRMTLVNCNEQTARLMKTLGIDKLLDVHKAGSADSSAAAAVENAQDADFKCGEACEVSKLDRIIHMIEAHQSLCTADQQNTVRFESVLKFLSESLDREKDK